MNESLASILVSDNLSEINVTLEAVRSIGDTRLIQIHLEEYIDHFGYDSEFCPSDLETLCEEYLTEDELSDGVEFTSATIQNYDFKESIEFDNLLQICETLYDCTSRDERLMVIDYITYVSYIGDHRTLKEIRDNLAFRDMDALIDYLKVEECVGANQTMLDYVDFERWAEDIIRYDYTETPNGFIFHL